jgi:hypothetical protein
MISWIKKYLKHVKETYQYNQALAGQRKMAKGAKKVFDKMWDDKQKMLKSR